MIKRGKCHHVLAIKDMGSHENLQHLHTSHQSEAKPTQSKRKWKRQGERAQLRRLRKWNLREVDRNKPFMGRVMELVGPDDAMDIIIKHEITQTQI